MGFVQQMPSSEPLGHHIPWGGGGSTLQRQHLLKLQVLPLVPAPVPHVLLCHHSWELLLCYCLQTQRSHRHETTQGLTT